MFRLIDKTIDIIFFSINWKNKKNNHLTCGIGQKIVENEGVITREKTCMHTSKL